MPGHCVSINDTASLNSGFPIVSRDCVPLCEICFLIAVSVSAHFRTTISALCVISLLIHSEHQASRPTHFDLRRACANSTAHGVPAPASAGVRGARQSAPAQGALGQTQLATDLLSGQADLSHLARDRTAPVPSSRCCRRGLLSRLRINFELLLQTPT